MHRSWSRAALAIVAAIVIPATAPTHAESERIAASAEDGESRKTLLMHYMPWYRTPNFRQSWGEHWTGWDKAHNPEKLDENGLPDIQSHYHPLIGPYDSADPDALECHLLQMKLAGIDGVIVDWYGTAKAADYHYIQTASEAMFEAAGRFDMDFVACYEDRTVQFLHEHHGLKPSEYAEHMSGVFSWLEDNWFSGDQYFRIDGRPLLLNFGPIFVKDRNDWDAAFDTLDQRPAFFGLHHLWKSVGGDGGFTWVHKKAWDKDPTPEQVRKNLFAEYNYSSSDPSKIIPSATPGFHDIYQNTFGYLDHREGQTLRDSLGASMAGEWPIVQLVTWNDYGEGTMFEPTHEFGYLFLEIVQETRRAEAGGSFPFTADDLRLPARLYKHRKSGEASDTDLDRISALISSGNTSAAKAALDRLDR